MKKKEFRISKKSLNKLRIISILIFMCFVGLYLYVHLEEKHIRENGNVAEAIVYAQKYGYNVRGGLMCVSWAHYVVNDSIYEFHVFRNVPINTKFKVAYLPQKPGYALVLNPSELKKYPFK